MEVKIARIRKGMKQTELAQLLNISTKTLISIEKGNYKSVNIPLSKKISKILNVPVEKLFFNENNKDNEVA